jgi:acyl-CoA synthetase (AMP-forming)/AMP-acid ligase II
VCEALRKKTDAEENGAAYAAIFRPISRRAPHSRKGEQPVAYVVPNDGAVIDEKALRHFMRRKLANYKIPKKVVLLSALPRNSAGKILKTTLREMPLPSPDVINLCTAIAYNPISAAPAVQL